MEGGLSLPAELRSDLRRVDGVAEVVARPVGNEPDQAMVVRKVGAHLLGEEFEELMEQLEVGEFGVAADVVGLPFLSLLQNRPDRLGVVIDVEPFAHLGAAAKDRERLQMEGVLDHAGNELLGVLVGAIVVAAVRDGG